MADKAALALAEMLAERAVARGLEPVRLPVPVAVDDLPTPALLLDLEQFETNLARMHGAVAHRGLALRPHTKMHRCPEVARQQVLAGARGLCVAKVAEAEVMAALGVELLLTSPLASALAADRLARVAQRCPVLVVVDSAAGVDLLDQAAAAAGVRLGVLVDVDPGLGRTGAPPAAVAPLARQVATAEHLDLRGLQAYAGNVQHIQDFAEREAASAAAWAPALALAEELAADGLPMAVVSGGGTGTWDIDCRLAGVTELQAGSYAFMDGQYAGIAARSGLLGDEFPPALSMLATCISSPQPGQTTVDAGIKVLATDAGAPLVLDPQDGPAYRFAGDEHGIIAAGQPVLHPGSRVHLLAPHCDPTVNLHDVLLPVRSGEVAELWPITARGCSW